MLDISFIETLMKDLASSYNVEASSLQEDGAIYYINAAGTAATAATEKTSPDFMMIYKDGGSPAIKVNQRGSKLCYYIYDKDTHILKVSKELKSPAGFYRLIRHLCDAFDNKGIINKKVENWMLHFKRRAR